MSPDCTRRVDAQHDLTRWAGIDIDVFRDVAP